MSQQIYHKGNCFALYKRKLSVFGAENQSGIGGPGFSGFKALFNNCKAGQHIRNRGSDHTGQHDYRYHDTSSGVAVMAAEGIAARAPLHPMPCRQLPAVKSSHCYDDRVQRNNTHGIAHLNMVVTDDSAQMVRSRIVADNRGDQRS